MGLYISKICRDLNAVGEHVDFKSFKAKIPLDIRVTILFTWQFHLIEQSIIKPKILCEFGGCIIIPLHLLRSDSMCIFITYCICLFKTNN